MVDKNNNSNNQTDGTVNMEKSQADRQRSEQPRNRSNYQRYNQGQRAHNQNRPQNNTQSAEAQSPAKKEAPVHNQNTAQNSRFQPGLKNSTRGSRTHETQPRENGQQRGNYRDKIRENDRDAKPRQHSTPSAGRYGNAVRNRAEETIDDVKLDIIRLEKEIELEIREIKSLKL